jgi:hypothetical protein
MFVTCRFGRDFFDFPPLMSPTSTRSTKCVRYIGCEREKNEVEIRRLKAIIENKGRKQLCTNFNLNPLVTRRRMFSCSILSLSSTFGAV